MSQEIKTEENVLQKRTLCQYYLVYSIFTCNICLLDFSGMLNHSNAVNDCTRLCHLLNHSSSFLSLDDWSNSNFIVVIVLELNYTGAWD